MTRKSASLARPLYLAIHAAFWSPVLLAKPALAQEAASRETAAAFDIAPGPLAQVVAQYAGSAGVALSFDAARLQGLQSPGLQGRYSIDAGFAQLLSGSGRRAERQANGAYMLVPVATQQIAAPLELSATQVTVSTLRNDKAVGRTPQRVTVIERADIERQLALSSDPGQVLGSLIPSYSPSRQKMSSSGETLRGRSPLFLVDGVPQGSSLRDDSRSSYAIDLAQVERIEVIHGATAEHGLGSTGGIINFITKRASGDGLRQRAGVRVESGEHGSDGLGYKFNYQASLQQDQWEALLAATWQERGAYRDADGRLIGTSYLGEIQDSRDHDLMLKLGYWLDDDQHLSFSANQYELKGHNDYVAVPGNVAAAIPTTARKGDPGGEPAFNRTQQFTLGYAHNDLFGNELDVQLYRQRYQGQFGTLTSASFVEPEVAPDGFDQSRSISDKWGGKFTLRRSGLFDGWLDLAGGVDLLRDESEQYLSLTNRVYVPPSTYDNQAIFLQGDLHPTERLTLTAGVRREHAELEVDTYRTLAANNGVTVTGGELSFGQTLSNYGFTYQANDWAQLYGGYSEGFGMPDVGRVLRGLRTPGLAVESLLELEPIITRSRELGLRLEFGRVDAELSYYESFSNQGERLAMVNGLYVANRERIEIEGFEATANWRITDDHRLRLAYSQSKGWSDTNDDGRVDTTLDGLNIAPNHYSLGWNATWNEDWSSYLQYDHYVSRSFDSPNLHFDGYSLLSASVSRALPVGSLSLSIDNLLDEDYFTYYSQAGRVANDSNFKGRGRTFALAYQVEF